MKLKTLMLAAGAALGLTFAAGSAQALTIAQIIAAFPNFQFEDNYRESHVDNNGNGVLDEGDTLRGIAEFQAITDRDSPAEVQLLPALGNSNLSAVFEVEVTDRTFVSAGADTIAGNSDDLYDFVFGPSASFPGSLGVLPAGTVPNGTMIAFFEDNADNVVFSGATCDDASAGGNCEDNVTDGTFILALGFGDDPDQFWAANDAVQDPSLGTTESGSSDLGGFNFQVDTLFSSVGEFGENQPTFIDGLPGGNNLVEWLGSGTVKGTSDLSGPYQISGDTDLTASAIPEPGTLGLMGAGLVALAGFARRKFRKAA